MRISAGIFAPTRLILQPKERNITNNHETAHPLARSMYQRMCWSPARSADSCKTVGACSLKAGFAESKTMCSLKGGITEKKTTPLCSLKTCLTESKTICSPIGPLLGFP